MGIAAAAIKKDDNTLETLSDFVTKIENNSEKSANQLTKLVSKILESIKENHISYDEIEMLEYELRQKKREFKEKNPEFKINKSRKNNSETEATISYNQRKINGKFYWYKQYSKDGKKYTEYIKEIDKENIEIDKSSISFHPDFLHNKK